MITPATRVVGHRGWPTIYPDNTLPGFLAATSVVDGVEMDIRRSGDGKLVLSHDPTLGGLVVSETPWSVLAEVDLGDGHHPALLDEVLPILDGSHAQLEVKNTPGEPGFEPDHRLALETAERARTTDLVTSFNPSTVAAVRRHFPDVATGLAIGAFGDIDDAVRLCLETGHVAIIPLQTMLRRPPDEALDAGLAVYPWVVNDPSRARELVDWGVSGIITDDPGLIIASVENQE